MTQPLHRGEVGTLDLLCRGLAHLRCGRPVKFSRQEVDGTFLDIDLGDTIAGVEAAEIEIEVAVEYTVGLAGVHMLGEVS